VKLCERWGIAAELQGRLVQAPPGIPVGALVARGEVALGFQQLSELMNLDGITVVGPLPPALHVTTTFFGAGGATSHRAAAVRALLAFMASPAATPVKQRNGMEPATTTRTKQ